MVKKVFFTFCILLPFVVYIFSALFNSRFIFDLIASPLSFSEVLPLIIYMPLWELSLTPTTYILILNTLLSTLYIALLIHTIAARRRERVLYGLSGSVLGVLSIGCVSCGALLSPLAAFALLGIPASFLGSLSLTLLVLGTILLAVGIFSLAKNLRGSESSG